MRIFLTALLIACLTPASLLAAPPPIPDGPKKFLNEDGSTDKIENYKDGVLDGEQKYFYEDGTVSAIMTYAAGVRNGVQQTFHPNGKLSRSWSEKNDQWHGKARYYKEDGSLWYETTYADGKLLNEKGELWEGERRVLYDNGKPSAEAMYHAGLMEGLRRDYYPSGVLEQETPYVQGKEHGQSISYDEEGHKVQVEAFEYGKSHGEKVMYYPSGALFAKGTFKNGKEEGVTQTFYETGKLMAEFTMANDMQNGPTRSYFEDGKLEGIYNYVNDDLTGETKEYYESGTLAFAGRYENGEVVNEERYYEDGTKRGQGYPLMQENNKVLFGFLWFAAFLISLTFHEAAHAWAAHKLGDDTAYEGGQVSLDPLPHIRREPVGTVLVPLLSYFYSGSLIGWASAPYDPKWALDYPKRAALMSLAGPAANFVLFLGAFIILKIVVAVHLFYEPDTFYHYLLADAASPNGWPIIGAFLSIMCSLNLVLFVFNLIPLPPLDGSGVLPLVLPDKLAQAYLTIIQHPGLMLAGLYLAWNFFDYLFDPIFLFMVNALHPGIGYSYS